MMAKITIYNSAELGALISGLASKDEYPLNISYSTAGNRSISANSQYYVWLPTIAKFYGEDVEYIRKWMKHDIAWPIVERGGCDYAKRVRYVLDKSGYYRLSQTQKINMVDLFSMTSVMNSKQHTSLRDELQAYWGKQGLQLDYLNDR